MALEDDRGINSNEIVQNASAFKVFRLFRLLKLLRLVRAFRIFQRNEDMIKPVLFAVALILAVTFTLHCLACFWFLVRRCAPTCQSFLQRRQAPSIRRQAGSGTDGGLLAGSAAASAYLSSPAWLCRWAPLTTWPTRTGSATASRPATVRLSCQRVEVAVGARLSWMMTLVFGCRVGVEDGLGHAQAGPQERRASGRRVHEGDARHPVSVISAPTHRLMADRHTDAYLSSPAWRPAPDH
jgi:hypothetical protein